MKGHDFFTSEKHEFLKDESGYYTMIEGKKYRVSAINDKSPEEYLKLSINESGGIVYFIGTISAGEKASKDVIAELISGKEIRQERIILFKPQQFRERFKEAYTLSEIDEVPVVHIRNMLPVDDKDNSLNKFINDAKKLANYSKIIIDIRGNGGGNSYYPQQWMGNFTGDDLHFKQINFVLMSNTTARMFKEIIQIEDLSICSEMKDKITENFRLYISEEERWSIPEWSISLDSSNYRIENETFVIVLMDENVFSSGETFIKLLRRFSRIIFVGANSAGSSSIGTMNSYVLPNSNMTVRFGMTMFMDPTKDCIEVGLKPDFWLPPNVALDRVMKMIRKYDL
ncbi:MAG: S41 family peptidase [Alkaliphilus sp.]